MKNEIIKKRLLELLRELSEQEHMGRAATDTVELDQSRVGRLSRIDALQSQAMSKESLRRRTEQKHRIQPALDRLEKGDYGRCIDCDEEISSKRLEIDPTCMLCIECADYRESKS